MQKEIPWWHPVLGEQEKTSLSNVIDIQFPNHGKYTIEFEKKIAELCEVPYAVAVTSCTAGIFLSFKAAGIGVGDEVIIPDITFISTANAVSLSGAVPVLVDVRKENFSIDPQRVREAITSKTKAIVPVHVSGHPADISTLETICQENNLYLIEDAAEAFGSCYKMKPLGSFGFTGCLSFTATKLFTTGQGGVVLMKDEEAYYAIRALRDHGRPSRGTGHNDIHDCIGFNFKYTDLQAAVGVAQLSSFEERIEHRKKIYDYYCAYLKETPKIRLIPFNIQEGEVPLWIDAVAENREQLCTYLKENKVDTRPFWHPLHTQKPYFRRDAESFLNAQIASHRGLWLPSAMSLTKGDVKYVCGLINTFYE